MRREFSGEHGWIALACLVVAVDIPLMLLGRKTMTEVWRDALRHPKHRWIVIVSWLFVTKHLFFGNYVSWFDPFHVIAIVVGGIKKAGEQLTLTRS